MAKSIYYQKVPEMAVLKRDFMQFMEQNPQFKGVIKIGKTSRQRLSKRYSSTSKYEQLDESNVFCYCSSEILALKIERICQDFYKKTGFLIPGSDGSEGTISDREHSTGVVYVTKLRPEDERCEICEFYYEKNLQEKHMIDFHMGNVKEMNERKKMIERKFSGSEEEKNFLEIYKRMLKWYDGKDETEDVGKEEDAEKEEEKPEKKKCEKDDKKEKNTEQEKQTDRKEQTEGKFSSKLMLRRKIPETIVIDKLTSSSSSSTQKEAAHSTPSSEDEIIKPQKAKKIKIIDSDEEKEEAEESSNEEEVIKPLNLTRKKKVMDSSDEEEEKPKPKSRQFKLALRKKKIPVQIQLAPTSPIIVISDSE